MRDTDIEAKLPNYLTDIFNRFYEQGEEAYLVGGSLRDIMRGEAPHDYDLTASAAPEKTKEIFSGFRVIDTGIKHGTVTVIYENEPIEITTFRIDGEYTDSRHPDRVSFTRKIEQDLARRDFTVNAMAYNNRRGLVDPYGGRDDLSLGIIRAVGDSRRRFSEDALRIMRAFRFSAQLGFSVDGDTLSGAVECMGGLSVIARERIGAEFLKLLLSAEPKYALKLMTNSGALPYIMGKYAPNDRIFEDISKMPATDTARLGFLLSRAETDEARQILHGLKYSNAQIKGTLAVARGAKMTLDSQADARRFIGECGIYSEWGVTASVLLGNSPAEAIEWVRDNKAPCTLRELAVGGRELTDMGFSGREVGEVLSHLLAEVIAEPSLNTKEELCRLAEEYRKNERA